MSLVLLGALGAQRGQLPMERLAAFTERLSTTDDIGWLERLSSSSDFFIGQWRANVGTQPSGQARVAAYVRLGVIGTPASVAAIARVETTLRGQRLLAERGDPGTWWPARQPGRSDGVLDQQPTIPIRGQRYASSVRAVYGPLSLYLQRERSGVEGGGWTRPMLASAPLASASSVIPSLSQGAGGLHVEFIARPGLSVPATLPGAIDIDPAEVSRDSDGDGWTDIEERHLGMNPQRVDSDNDGLADGVDVCPLYAVSSGEAADEEALILRRALFVTYGIAGSREAIFVLPGVRHLQLEGHAGPVLYDVTIAVGRGRAMPPPMVGGIQVTWSIGSRTGTDATVTFTHRSGFFSASQVVLKKMAGEWLVVGNRLTGIG